MSDCVPLLEAVGVRRQMPGAEQYLLHDISLAIFPGQRVAITGPTGSGKTLLLRALARLDAMDAGEVRWRGKAIGGDAIPAFRRQVMYLHQRPALVEGTVEENLRLPFAFRGHRERTFSRELVVDLLSQVDREPSFLQRETRALSGGEAQVAALLRAVQLQPLMLLLDEPTAALDADSATAIERLVRRWMDDAPAQRAVIWVSHNRRQIERVADRKLAMSGGQLFERDGNESEQTR